MNQGILKNMRKKYSAYNLLGKKFLLMIDHHSLANYLRQPTLKARQACWADFLSEFDFEIRNLKGKENWVTNALSQKVNCLYEIYFNESRTTSFEQIRETTMQDLEYTFMARS